MEIASLLVNTILHDINLVTDKTNDLD